MVFHVKIFPRLERMCILLINETPCTLWRLKDVPFPINIPRTQTHTHKAVSVKRFSKSVAKNWPTGLPLHECTEIWRPRPESENWRLTLSMGSLSKVRSATFSFALVLVSKSRSLFAEYSLRSQCWHRNVSRQSALPTVTNRKLESSPHEYMRAMFSFSTTRESKQKHCNTCAWLRVCVCWRCCGFQRCRVALWSGRHPRAVGLGGGVEENGGLWWWGHVLVVLLLYTRMEESWVHDFASRAEVCTKHDENARKGQK